MKNRARGIVHWPGLSADIDATRDLCSTCNRIAPSQPQTFTSNSASPSTPFEQIVADYFELRGKHYLVTADRLSGWATVTRAQPGTANSGSKGLIAALRLLFTDKGVPEEIASDGGREFVATETKDFLKKWGVNHRVSSAYFAQSNGRAEAAVKTVKRLLQDATSPCGSLDTDAFMVAMMAHRNTPDQESGLSPAQVLYGRDLPDAMKFKATADRFSDKDIRPQRREA